MEHLIKNTEKFPQSNHKRLKNKEKIILIPTSNGENHKDTKDKSK